MTVRIRRGGACNHKIIEKSVPQVSEPHVDKFLGVMMHRNMRKCTGVMRVMGLRCDVGHTQRRCWFAYSCVLVAAEPISSPSVHSNSQPSPLSSHRATSLASLSDGLMQAIGSVVGACSGRQDTRRLGVGFPVGHFGVRKVDSRPVACVYRPSPPGVHPLARRPQS